MLITDPSSRFCLLLSDGKATSGLPFDPALQDVLRFSHVRVYPIAYGNVDRAELEAIAATREGSVYDGSTQTVQTLLRNLLQTQL